MPEIRITWTGRRPAVLDVAPLALTIWNEHRAATPVLVAPDETFSAPDDATFGVIVVLPRYKTVHAEFRVGDTAEVTLEADEITAGIEAHGIDIKTPYADLPLRRTDGTRPESAKKNHIGQPIVKGEPIAATELVSNRASGCVDIRSIGDGVELSTTSIDPLSTVLKVRGGAKLTQSIVVPFIGSGSDALRIRELTAIGNSPRLRVEPTDDYAALLYDYLVQGDFALAAVAARSVARKRANATLLSWSGASFPQLLIGYAYALGGDVERLSAWCRRTDPTWSLGSDGYVLDIADQVDRFSKHSSDADICYRLTKLAAMPPPSTYFGLRLALRLINVLAFAPERRDSSLPPALAALQHKYTKLLADTDPESVALSFQKPARPGFLASLIGTVEHNVRYMAWTVITWIRRARRRIEVQKDTVGRAPLRPHDHTPAMKATSKGTTMAPEPQDTQSTTSAPSSSSPTKLSLAATAVAIFAIALWAAFTLLLFFYVEHNELEWTRLTWLFGSVQAIAFAAAGALFGTVVQKDRADQAEKRADSAQADADAQRDAAVKGKALASVLQAEGTEDDGTKGFKPMSPGQPAGPQNDVRRDHARLSRALFGNLID